MTCTDIKPIETIYKGYRFRSRLEARWAVFFDKAGIKYEYEKEGFDLNGRWYLPDFYLPDVNSFVEIKPSGFDTSSIDDLMIDMAQAHEHAGVYVICGDPYPDAYKILYYYFNDGGATLGAEVAIIDLIDLDDILVFAPKYIPACRAARSARFEHGETP